MLRTIPIARTFLIAMLLIAGSAQLVDAQPMFVIADRKPAARGPMFATTGAIAAGGAPGVAVASFWVDEVTLFRVAPGGILVQPSTLPVGRNLRDLVAVDLNADGLDDLVISDETGGSRDARLLPYMNTSGAFQALNEVPLETTLIQSMRTGNFDGVEPSDFATANGRLSTVSVIYGRGPQLAPSGNIFLGGVTTDVAALDFDGDGLDDLTVLTEQDDGRSEVTTLHSEAVGFALRPPAIQLDITGVRMTRGDFDGDGVFDLAVVGKGTNDTEYAVRTLLTRRPVPAAGEPLFTVESRSFTCPLDHGMPSRCTLFDTVSADFDRNDRDDLAISMPDPGVVAILPRQRPSIFGAPAYLEFSGSPRGLATGDVSGDQVADLVVTEFNDDAVSIAVSVVPPLRELGAPCTEGMECGTGACVDGACCLALQCSPPERCDITEHRGSCTRPLPPGSTCEKNADCRSAMCSAVAPASGFCLPGTSGQACAGDCNGDGVITVDEILLVIRIALAEIPISVCPSADSSGDGQITVDEIITAVDFALEGCPPSVPGT